MVSLETDPSCDHCKYFLNEIEAYQAALSHQGQTTQNRSELLDKYQALVDELNVHIQEQHSN